MNRPRFTLIKALFLLATIGIFAAIIIPYLLDAVPKQVDPFDDPFDDPTSYMHDITSPSCLDADNPPLNTIDRLLEEMEFGAIAFNAPISINIDDSPHIQLVMSLSETAGALKDAITKEGERIGATIKVSERMEARLTGPMFEITPITTEIQAVSESHRTEWAWQIHPIEKGTHSLSLVICALVVIDGQNTPRKISTFERTIEVEVTTLQLVDGFIRNNWQWLWVAILLPVFGWLLNRRRKRTP